MIEIEVAGIKKLIGELEAMPEPLIRSTILRMSEIAFKSAQKSASKYNRTGALYQSLYNKRLYAQAKGDFGRRVGHDTNRAPHARFILWGTREHEITPKNKKALRWVNPKFTGPFQSGGKSSGGFFFSKGHSVKGIKADQYIIRAADDASAAFQSIVDKSFKESI